MNRLLRPHPSPQSRRASRALAALVAVLMTLACASPALAAKGGGSKLVAVQASAIVDTDDVGVHVTVAAGVDKIASQVCAVDAVEIPCELGTSTKKETTYFAFGVDLAPGEHVFTADFVLTNGAAGGAIVAFTI